MKKIFLLLICVILCFYSFSQEKVPSYPVVLRTFFNKYIAIDENDNYTSLKAR